MCMCMCMCVRSEACQLMLLLLGFALCKWSDQHNTVCVSHPADLPFRLQLPCGTCNNSEIGLLNPNTYSPHRARLHIFDTLCRLPNTQISHTHVPSSLSAYPPHRSLTHVPSSLAAYPAHKSLTHVPSSLAAYPPHRSPTHVPSSLAAYPPHRSLTHVPSSLSAYPPHRSLTHTSHPPLQLALTRLHFAPDFEGLQIALQLWQDGAGTSPLNSCSYIEVCVCVCVCVCALACTRVCL